MNSLAKFCLQKTIARAFRALGQPCTFKQHLKAYRTNEDGSMAILTLSFFILFLIMGGLGLAVMRHEMNRAKLSVTIDAAVLAGGGAPAGATVSDIKAIVEDYFAKNGMASNLNAIDTDGVGIDDIVTSLNTRRVSASASMTINTYLLKLVGVDTLTAASAGTAEISTPKMEVSLVLDVSGSMSGNKLTSLKSAANEFVTTILNSGDPGDISISIIPFSMGVTPPDTVFNALNIDQTHNNSNCIVFLENDFSNTAIDPATPYRQQIYTWANGDGFPFNATNQFWRSCYEDAYFEILPYSMSETALHNKINSLVARGMTSGHLGIKWGTALLDPAFQSVATALQASGEMDPALVNVPSNYGEQQTLKIIVMMGDGQNTRTYYFDDPNQLNDESVPENHSAFDYRGPNSDLYRVNRVDNNGNAQNPLYYIKYPPGGWYYDTKKNKWITETKFNNLTDTLSGFVDSNPVSWETAWGMMTPLYYSQIIGDYSAWNDYIGREFITGSMKNTRMRSACSSAKTQGIVIYTIGFEVSKNGTAETELRNCAQSVANYFPVDSVSISDAFSAIASNVQNLRLTQ